MGCIMFGGPIIMPTIWMSRTWNCTDSENRMKKKWWFDGASLLELEKCSSLLSNAIASLYFVDLRNPVKLQIFPAPLWKKEKKSPLSLIRVTDHLWPHSSYAWEFHFKYRISVSSVCLMSCAFFFSKCLCPSTLIVPYHKANIKTGSYCSML